MKFFKKKEIFLFNIIYLNVLNFMVLLQKVLKRRFMHEKVNNKKKD